MAKRAARDETAPLRAVAYLRVSTAEQADSGAGLAAQRMSVEAEAQRRGWVLTEVYIDTAASGKAIAGREQLALALQAVGSGQAAVPTGVFSQLLAQLAGQMAKEYADSMSVDSEAAEVDFMRDGRSGFYGDPANAQDRAAHLWNLLNAAQSERLSEAIAMESAASEAVWADSEQADWDGSYDSETDYFDQLDFAEAEAIEAALDADLDADTSEAEADSYVW